MKLCKFFLIVLLFNFPLPVVSADPVGEAEKYFENGLYYKGLDILNDLVRDKNSESNLRIRARLALAKFYDLKVGNYKKAYQMYSTIFEEKAAQDNPVKNFAEKELKRLDDYKSIFQSEDKLIFKMQVETSRRKDSITLDKHIIELGELIENNQDYYRLSDAYYYQALNYIEKENYGKAYKLLLKSLELKPAIYFYLPVKSRLKNVRENWIRDIIRTYSWGLATCLLVLTAPVFYHRAPWKNLTCRDTVIFLLLLVLWSCIFWSAFYVLVKSYKPVSSLTSTLNLATPAFISPNPGSPGSHVIGKLYLYGITGVLGMFVFSFGITDLKRLWMKLMVNGVYGLLLFTCLSSLFYLQYIDRKSLYYSTGTGVTAPLHGRLYMVLKEPEPYFLTNPLAYPHIQIGNISDPVLREWAKKYCVTDDSFRKNITSGK